MASDNAKIALEQALLQHKSDEKPSAARTVSTARKFYDFLENPEKAAKPSEAGDEA